MKIIKQGKNYSWPDIEKFLLIYNLCDKDGSPLAGFLPPGEIGEITIPVYDKDSDFIANFMLSSYGSTSFWQCIFIASDLYSSFSFDIISQNSDYFISFVEFWHSHHEDEELNESCTIKKMLQSFYEGHATLEDLYKEVCEVDDCWEPSYLSYLGN